MKKRTADIEYYNQYYQGEDKDKYVGTAFASGDSDKVFVEYVLNRAWWMLEHATGECTLTLHINPTQHKYEKKDNHVHRD